MNACKIDNRDYLSMQKYFYHGGKNLFQESKSHW